MIKSWSVAAVVTVVLVVISVNFLDRPTAWFFYRVFGHLMIVRQFAATPSFFGPFELFTLLIFFIRRIALYPLSRADAALLLCEASLLATKSLVSPMKFFFGRPWPLYGHPSFLLDGAYGFNFLTAGQEAFPSGHAASVCAVVSVLWVMYPRFKRLYVAAVAAIGLALVAGDFHFLSDVIAGGFLGTTVAMLILAASDFARGKLSSAGLRLGALSGCRSRAE